MSKIDDLDSNILEERVLHRLRFGLEAQHAASFLTNPIDVDVRVDVWCDMIVAQCRSFVWTEKIGEVRYPANWIEAFRERWWPEWAKRRWQICYITALDVRAMFPTWRAPQGLGEFRFMALKPEEIDGLFD